ncbi:anti-sigma-D factor RsdA, partial [Gordonia sp. (in: high G+C Gram-positive bacteria)]|uniref:anti-sigma-D factor RsdA n=1 Tax=Gordonia sp. (in: high G+C Gram-positive bacteria) TaxID=84139 RepID=UPI0039E3670A
MKDLTPDEPNGGVADLDVASITRDDEMLEALGLGLPVVADTAVDYELAELLAGWRAGVHEVPLESGITVDDVEHAIAAGAAQRQPDRRVGRRLRLVAGAAAAMVVALGGLSILSEGANPNDALWGIKKVAHPSKAVQTQAAFDAQGTLAKAEQALAAGKPTQARELMKRAQATLTPIANKEDRAEIDARIARLSTSIDSAIKASAPAKKPTKKPQQHVAPPTVTDDMPQYVPPQVQVPQYTPPPVQAPVVPQQPAPQAPQQAPAPEP